MADYRQMGLIWGENQRQGATHAEWHWNCDGEGNGCALHQLDGETMTLDPHVHRCELHDTQKPLFTYSDMTDRFYLVTSYVDQGDGRIEARHKIDVTDEFYRVVNLTAQRVRDQEQYKLTAGVRAALVDYLERQRYRTSLGSEVDAEAAAESFEQHLRDYEHQR